MIDTIWYIGGILFIAVGIGISIGLHELGHMVPAKRFGVKVPTYAIGFGPTIFKFKRGETTYAIKLIPVGGYISMIGMYPPAKREGKPRRGFFADMIKQARVAHAEHITPADSNRKFYQLPVLKRLIIMFGGPFMNLVLGVVLMFTVFSGLGTMQIGTTVSEVAPCIIADPTKATECSASDATSPASAAGIKSGDKLISINGQQINQWQQIGQNLNAGQPATLELLRDGKQIQLSATPVSAQRVKLDATGNPVLDSSGDAVMEPRPVLGLIFANERKQLSLGESMQKSAVALGQVGQMIVTLPKQLMDVAASTFAGQPRNPNGAVSVVGVAQISGEVAAAKSVDLVEKLSTGLLILASLNFALFGFNMLPLLPLDGGHIAGGIYEATKRRLFRLLKKPDPGPADTALLMPATWFVFVLLMAMSALLILADVIHPITLG
ncbi:MAG: M50 family metallopeptidase [Rhodoluna sp.]